MTINCGLAKIIVAFKFIAKFKIDQLFCHWFHWIFVQVITIGFSIGNRDGSIN